MKRQALAMGLAAALVALLAACTVPAHAQLSIGSDLNPDCINMRIVYTTCGVIPYPCAKIRFWQPKWIVKTTADKGFANAGGQHFHFHDARVEPVTQGFAFSDPCAGCVVPTLNAVVDHFYDSKDDPEWKTAQKGQAMPPEVANLNMLFWGGAYPRVGYVNHPSPACASGLAAVRAFNIARQPFDLWPNQGNLRNTYAPLLPNAANIILPCMNMEKPRRMVCHRAGHLDKPWLLPVAPTSADGEYKWVIWKRRRCTLPLPLNWCAEELNGKAKRGCL